MSNDSHATRNDDSIPAADLGGPDPEEADAGATGPSMPEAESPESSPSLDNTLAKAKAPKGRARGKASTEVQIERVPCGRVTIYRDLAVSPMWYMQYQLDGRQLKPSLKTPRKKDAIKLAEKKNSELIDGTAHAPAKAILIAQIIETYLASLKDRRRDEKTLILYRRDLEQFQAYCLEQGVKRLDHANTDLLERYKRVLESTGYLPPDWKDKKTKGGRPDRRQTKSRPNAPRTVRTKMKNIKQLIKFALKRGTLRIDPAPGYYLPEEVKTQAECWDASTLEAVLNAADSTTRKLLDFLRFTGLRNDELCWLTRDDVELGKHPRVRVRAKACPQTGRSWRPKHGNERVVPLGAEALAIAREAAAASKAAGVPWLFVAPGTRSKQGGRWQSARVLRLLKAAMKSAGVRKGTVHTLRHVYCSFLANQGVSPFQVMKLMGHGSMEIVLKYYHVGEFELCDVVAALDFKRMLEKDPKATPNGTQQSTTEATSSSTATPSLPEPATQSRAQPRSSNVQSSKDSNRGATASAAAVPNANGSDGILADGSGGKEVRGKSDAA